jgi:Mg-chelatase subunit ChlD
VNHSTLVRTTLTGVRPLGVRGEPLHHAQEQIRGAIRRRLGPRHAALLAEPVPHDLGRAIDWYSDAGGDALPLNTLPLERQQSVLDEVERLRSDIEVLAQRFEAGDTQDARLLGKALHLAVRRPSNDYLFLVGDQPVIICWGYEPEAAGAVLPPPSLPAPAPAAQAIPMAAMAPAMLPPHMAGGAAALPASATFPWGRALLVGLLTIVLLLVASWLLRGCTPVDPAVSIFREAPQQRRLTRSMIPIARDRTATLTDELRDLQARERNLGVELASLRESVRRAVELCPPPPPPAPPEAKPPAVASIPTPPPAAAASPPPPMKAAAIKPPAPKPADCPPTPAAGRPRTEVMVVLDGSDSMNLPSGFTTSQEDELLRRARSGDRGAIMEFRAMTRGPGQKRIDDAKQAASRIIPRLPGDVDVGYMVFDDCRSVQDHGFFGAGQRGELVGRIQGTIARGGTPLARAVQQAGARLRSDDGVIIVFSDGKDSCGGNVCAVAQHLHAMRPKVKIHVIDLAGGTSEATCLATITGGRVYPATSAQAVTAALSQATAAVQVPAHCRAPAR